MKRIISFILAISMALSMTYFSAFANKSKTNVIDVPSSDNVEIPPVVDAKGNKVSNLHDKSNVSLDLFGMPVSETTKLTVAEKKAVENIETSNTYLQQVLDEVGINRTTKEVVLVGTYDLSLRYIDGTKQYASWNGNLVAVDDFDGWPLYINVTVSGIKKGEQAWLLHFDDTINHWENVTVGVFDGYIRGRFNSLSPVAVVRLQDNSDDNSGNSSSTGDGAANNSADSTTGTTSAIGSDNITTGTVTTGDNSDSNSSGSSSKKSSSNKSSNKSSKSSDSGSSSKKSPKTGESNVVYVMIGSAFILAYAGIVILNKRNASSNLTR